MPVSFDRKSVRYKSLEYPLKGVDEGDIESYQYVQMPQYDAGGKALKVMFVLDHIPTEDLKSGYLLSGHQGQLLSNVIRRVSEKHFLKESVRFSYLAVPFNAYKTAGRSPRFQAQAEEVFLKRTEFMISKYKPDVVIVMGHYLAKHFLPEELALSNNNPVMWFGVPREKTIKGHKTNVVLTLSLNKLSSGKGGEPALLGYLGRLLANGITNKIQFGVNNQELIEHKSVHIDTMKKFDILMSKLEEHTGPVAVDSETTNLNRIRNKLLTIQFAKCAKMGYVILIDHKDCPFSQSEVKTIKLRLRAFFEHRNKNARHIYVNATFDLNVFRSTLGVRFFKNKIYDVQAGEWAMDENIKFLKTVAKAGHFNLANIACQFGFTGYLSLEFGKEDRATIESRDFDMPLQRYTTYDVVVPFAIHEKQIERAKHLGHRKFLSLVEDQIGDMQQMFCKMEHTGNEMDIEYLFYLMTPDSPIKEEISRMEKKFLESKNVAQANKVLMQRKGVQSQGWEQDEVVSDIFSTGSPDHKQLLFIDILGLEPLKVGKSGKPKIDKAFQEHYKDVPEIKAFSAIGKAKTLLNNFVVSFVKKLGTSPDFKFDKHMRPSYKFLVVLTGRTSSTDPNLQNIPARSALGKNIKRLFIAGLGYLYIKVDYRVHEVRCWGLIASDAGVATAFGEAKKLRDEYRRLPNPELGKRLKDEADIHRINAAYFFSVNIDDVTKELRDDVKSVIFGLIYQMSIKTLAKKLGKTLEFTNKLVGNFRKRFLRGMKWIEEVKVEAKKNLFVESPTGQRRHLWGYLLPEDNPNANQIHADMERRAVNSPVQGMGAQCMAIGTRALEKMWWKILRKEKRDTGLQICNSVHDSLENKSTYVGILENIGLIEQALTTKVREEYMKRHGFKFSVDLEIDFEIGAALNKCEAWDFSLLQLEELVYNSLLFQRDELKFDISVKRAMKQVFVEGWERAPEWIKIQAKNLKWKYDYDTVVKRDADNKERARIAAEKKAKDDAAKAAAAEKAKSKKSVKEEKPKKKLKKAA